MNVSELIRREGFLRGLRVETIKTYTCCVEKFLHTYKKTPWDVTKKDFENYILQLQKWNKSPNTINVYINALKFFYEKVLHKKVTVKVNLLKKRRKIPIHLTQAETKKLFNVIHNSKHKLMITFLYATGMRVSELCSLRVRDFEFDQNYGWVREGKGGKDRLFVVAQRLKQEIFDWITQNELKKSDWLFSGQGSSHISTSSIRMILRKAVQLAKISKHVHPHTLRHSFATHLIENGYALTDVQPLLGHSSPTTTMIYLHMASPKLLNVESPYDTLLKTQ